MGLFKTSLHQQERCYNNIMDKNHFLSDKRANCKPSPDEVCHCLLSLFEKNCCSKMKCFTICLVAVFICLVPASFGQSVNVITLAGNGSLAFADGQGTGASFNNPRGVTVDSSGFVYVADQI